MRILNFGPRVEKKEFRIFDKFLQSKLISLELVHEKQKFTKYVS